MKKVPAPKVVMTLEALESPLPPQIQEALGELVGAAREGLLALSVGVGLGVVHELMELEVDEVVGPNDKPPVRAKSSLTPMHRGRLPASRRRHGQNYRPPSRGSVPFRRSIPSQRDSQPPAAYPPATHRTPIRTPRRGRIWLGRAVLVSAPCRIRTCDLRLRRRWS